MENDPGAYDPGAPAGLEPAASPHLAPYPEPAPRRRDPRRIALGAAAAIVVLAVVAWALAPRSAVVDGRGRALAPLRTASDPRTGEEVAPFSGFAISVETVPSGALVTIDGVERGEAPVLAGLDCAPGASVEIAARKAGLPAARATTTCRADALVKLTVRLSR